MSMAIRGNTVERIETPIFVYEERVAVSYKDLSAGSEQKFSSCRLVSEKNLVEESNK